MPKKNPHSIYVPNHIWEWATKESTNPGSYLRDMLAELMIARIQGTEPVSESFNEPEENYIWRSLNVEYDPGNSQLNIAKMRWISAFNDDELRAAKRLQDHVNRGIRDAREFLIKWAEQVEENSNA